MMLVSIVLGSVLAIGLIVVVSILTGGSTQATNVLDGTHVTAFSVPGLYGGTVRAPWATHHPAVVVFVASWCGPCKAEVPRVAAYASRHQLGSVRFVAIDVNDEAGPAKSFLTQAKVAFPVGTDEDSTLSSDEFHLAGLPDTVFVNASGYVTEVVVGSVSNGELATDINELR
jgi:thiol-disulfide isomerase/thioredoxin